MKTIKRSVVLLSMTFALSLTSQAQQPVIRDYTVNLENPDIQRYIDEVTYTPEDASVISSYYKGEKYFMYYPNPVVIDLPETTSDSLSVVCYVASTNSDSLTFRVPAATDKASLYNLIPRRLYNYEVHDGDALLQQGTIVTQGRVRFIKVDGTVNNVRDLGGWKTADGKMRIKYGKLFRGSELNWQYEATPAGLEMLRQLGVGAEIDMRARWEALDKSNGHPETEGVSVFGFLPSSSTPKDEVPTYLYTNDSGQLPSHMDVYSWQYRWRQEFQFIVNNLRQGRSIYYHCIYGRDRTGYLSLLLEGLLGLSYSDIFKEYELSNLVTIGIDRKSTFDEVISYIMSLSGETLNDKFTNFFKNKIRATQLDIDYFRSEMLEENIDNDIITAIREPMSVRTADVAPAVYDMSGRRVSQPRAGIYLTPGADGKYRKMSVK